MGSERDDGAPSDEALAEAAQKGEVRALEALVGRHQSRVLRVVAFLGVPAEDREDVAQEVFVRVFRHLGSYRSTQSFGAWIYRVSVNAAHDWRSRGATHRAVFQAASADDAELLADPGPVPGESLRDRELRQALAEALELLTDRERSVFVLKELEGLETAEVAHVLGVSSITVRRHLFQARRRLRAALGGREKKTALSLERIAPQRSRQG